MARVQYVMLNIVPELRMHADSSPNGLPKGAKVRFYVSYHDNEGSEFTATGNHVKYATNKIDKVSVSPSVAIGNEMRTVFLTEATHILWVDSRNSRGKR